MPLVVSINTSGQKFGLVYAAWGEYRGKSDLYRDAILELRECLTDSCSHKEILIFCGCTPHSCAADSDATVPGELHNVYY